MYHYIYIGTDEEQSYDPYPFYIRRMPVKVRSWYLWNIRPVRRTETEQMGVPGLEITIPFSSGQLMQCEAEKVSVFLERIIEREKAENIVVAPGLKKYMGSILCRQGDSLPLFFINEMVEDVRRKHRISRKDMALIILDEGETEVLSFLKARREELNYLTIVTERAEEFESFCSAAFEETGLLVQVTSGEDIQSGRSRLHGNIVVDYRQERDRLYRCFPENAVVLDVSGNRQKVKDVVVKRKDLKVYNRVEVFQGQEKLEPGIFEITLSDREEGAVELPESSVYMRGNIRINCCLTLDGV